MPKRISQLLLSILLVAAMVSTGWPIDAIYRKSAKTPAQGQITEVTKTGVTVKPRIGTPVTVPVGDIINIRWEGEPAGLNLARIAEQGGRLQDALDAYEEVEKDLPAGNANLKTDLAFLKTRTISKMALADPAKLPEAAKQLEDFRTKNPNSFRYYETLSFLGEVYMVQKDFDKARGVLAMMAKAPQNDLKMAARVAEGRLKLLENNLPGALGDFDAVMAMDTKKTPAELSSKYEAMLGKATCLQRQNKAAEAIKVLDLVVKEAPAEESAIQAQAYVRKGDALRALGNPDEAVYAYLYVDVLFKQEKALHAEALYRLTRLWPAVGKPDRAADAAAVLENEYPTSEWTKKLSSTGG